MPYVMHSFKKSNPIKKLNSYFQAMKKPVSGLCVFPIVLPLYHEWTTVIQVLNELVRKFPYQLVQRTKQRTLLSQGR